MAQLIKSHARLARHGLQLNQVVASVQAGISLRNLRRIESGDTGVPLKFYMQLAYSYGISPVELLPGLAGAPKQRLRFEREVQITKRPPRPGHSS